MSNTTDINAKSGDRNQRPSGFSIDIVIPWVDGNDPAHRAKRQKFMTDKGEMRLEDVGGNSRFDSIGEILYCVRSINLFARFVRKIFIVTDDQDPGLEEPMKEMFPEGHIPMEVIDHQVIFRGHKAYLPTFNSRAIETLIWNIPDLSEHFLLMNDDFILIKEVSPEDFFRDGSTVCYADKYLTAWAKLVRILRPRRRGHKRISFKDSMINAAEIMGGSPVFFYLGHTPRALKKSFYEDFFRNREDIIIRNIRHLFRHEEQFNSQELFYISEYRKGRCIVIPTDEKLLYLMPKNKKNYIDRKLESFNSKPDAPFCCINSLCLAEKGDREKVLAWVRDKLR